MKSFLFYSFLLFLGFITTLDAQENSKIDIEYADFVDINQDEIPDAVLLTGNVRVRHDGAIMYCNKAYFFQKENYIKAFGNVQMIQGDTIFLNSKYAEYNGNNKLAFAAGEVLLRSPEMTLETDTLNLDRNSQRAFYRTGGIINEGQNTLKSKAGIYLLENKKYQFRQAVTITNPENIIQTNHLDYYTNSGHSYLFGPSTITGKDSFIYTENGFYDTKKDLAKLLDNSYIKYNNRLIEGDSLYYDKNKDFASATNNVKITDSINNTIVKGHYGEVYRAQDSLMMTRRAVAMSLVEQDTLYIHGKKLIVTGKPEHRIIRAYPNVRFFKEDMSGKCDSLHSDEQNGLTKLIGKPVLWNYENQLTGDVMHLISNKETEKLDSLKVLNNTFIVSRDTLGSGYNQVKGQNLFGKFLDNKLHEVDIIKNTEVIYYMRNDDQELIGINKSVCSKINIIFDESEIESITFIKQVDGDIYPDKDLPENARKLRGFIWREDERIRSKKDIFPPEEDQWLEIIQKADLKRANTPLKPMEVLQETLDYDDENP